MKRLLKTLLVLTIVGVVVAWAWRRWQHRPPGPLWEPAESWAPPAAAPEPAETPEEPDVPPTLPAVVAGAGPLAVTAEDEALLAEDRALEGLTPVEVAEEPPPTVQGLPSWALPPVEEAEAPVALPAPAAHEALAPPPVEPLLAPVAAPGALPALEEAAPEGQRWYWPWQRPREAAPAPQPVEPAAPAPAPFEPPVVVEERPVAAEVEVFEAVSPPEPAPPAEERPVAEPDAEERPVAEPDAEAGSAAALLDTILAEEPVAAAPEAVAELVDEPAALPVQEVEAGIAPEPLAEEVEAETAPEPAAPQEGTFRWPWQTGDEADEPLEAPEPEAALPAADESDEVDEESVPPPPPPVARESTGFRWPWQRRKDEAGIEEAPPPGEAELVDESVFDDSGLGWGVTGELPAGAAAWLEDFPDRAVPAPAPEAAAAQEIPRLSAQEAPAPPSPPTEAAPEPLDRGMPLSGVLEEALDRVRPEPVSPYAGRAAESFLDEGNVYFNVGQYGLAIERYTRAVELDPNLTAGFYNRANARTRAGEYDLALHDYNRALELEPNDADALNNRGMLHLYRAGYGAALRDFNAALQIEPSDTTVIVNRGLAQLHGGDAAAALVDFQEAAALDDTDAAAHYGAAQAASALGNRDEALRRLRRALSLDPAYARDAAADPKLVTLQGDAEFMRILREAGGRR